MAEQIKNCMNCAHRYGGGFSYSKCTKSGKYTDLHRQFGGKGCDEDFSGWSERESVFQSILASLVFWKKK